MHHRFTRNPTFCGDFNAEDAGMTCHHVTMPGGGSAIVCTQTRRCKCGRRAPLLCDWKVPNKRSGTCDAPICERCATSPQTGKDLCAKHAKALEAWKASRSMVGNKA